MDALGFPAICDGDKKRPGFAYARHRELEECCPEGASQNVLSISIVSDVWRTHTRKGVQSANHWQLISPVSRTGIADALARESRSLLAKEPA
jgi:hypothetical protein